jgi:putative ABC transport system ATP-binding protein
VNGRIASAHAPHDYIAGMTPMPLAADAPRPLALLASTTPSTTGEEISVMELTDVTRRYDDGPSALSGVTLSVPRGAAVAARYRRARIGLVFQFFNLLADLTVADNVALPARVAGLGREPARRRAADLLDMLGVGRHARSYPGRLSGGERQRVAAP